jgi:hypothetical protein
MRHLNAECLITMMTISPVQFIWIVFSLFHHTIVILISKNKNMTQKAMHFVKHDAKTTHVSACNKGNFVDIIQSLKGM